MAKVQSEFVCQQCGYKSPAFLGKCPNCGEWNSLVETLVRSAEHSYGEQAKFKSADLSKLSEVKGQQLKRSSTGFSEFDRVLGGGIVPGSIILIAGDPGIGKSTLLLQAAMQIATARGPVSSFPPVSARSGQKSNDGKVDQANLRAAGSPSRTATPRLVLYVTGEESAYQIRIRADRLGKVPENLYILPQTEVEAILSASEKLNPQLLIIDSIQTLVTGELSGAAGSVGQVRQCAQALQRYAKDSHVPIFMVGHVTKEGSVAGPKVLEHIVDAVLNLEGDGMHAYRLLRSTKNRFGSTFEVGVFEMTDAGIVEVSNPSGIFLAQRLANRPGSVVTSTVAGGRPILAEVQALTTATIFGIPTRRVTGLDFGRIQIVLAALTRAANINLSSLDIYVNVAGGLRIAEPASDLAAALAVVSAVTGKPIDEQLCAFGEVGLLGELRPVSNSKSREEEAKRLGFAKIVSPSNFKTLEEAIGYAVHGG